ncbi:MAG: hypothetical protein R3321_14830 [Nitrososphaeraceae archaeon]|nr:hypothetical protein [Nitrososphaeraceae archaeon]
MFEDLVPYRRRPSGNIAEIDEIIEIIASGRPKITIDDVCDLSKELRKSDKDSDDKGGVDHLKRKRRKLAYN